MLSYWRADYSRYVEPFAGSATLFFAIEPPSALLGDINRELVDTFAAVRQDPDGVYRAVMGIPLGKESYLSLRQLDASGLSLTERAARFVFLNRFCFNGLYRTNMRGQFNVPYAPGRTGGVPQQAVFRACAKALERAELRCADFGELLGEARPGDFYYIDPPYATSRRRVFREYTGASFSVADLEMRPRTPHSDPAGHKRRGEQALSRKSPAPTSPCQFVPSRGGR